MSQPNVQERAKGLNSTQIAAVVLATCVVVLGFMVKLERAPSFGELVLDPVRLLVPIVLLCFESLRKKIGVTRQFAMMGIACVALTMMSEAFRHSFGVIPLALAFVVYIWMLGHCWKTRGVDSSWAGLALCFMLAPVF